MNEFEPDPEILREAFLEVVENQLEQNDPPDTRRTFNRLKAEGWSEEDAKLLIASAVAAETFHVLRDQREFDLKRFIRWLDQLPNQDFEE